MVNHLHNIEFLKEKVKDLKTALLYCNSESVLRLPTSVVTAVNVDDLGQIWLLVPRPKQSIKEFERNFPVKLNFYRKGREFYLNLAGKATIVLEPGEIDEMTENIDAEGTQMFDEWIMVRVEISDIQYHDTSVAEKNNSWISSFASQFNKWISQATEDYKPLAIH